MKSAFGVLIVVAGISAVQVDYIAPVASGYIYRSDNNGPPSLIQLGAVSYKQPHAFAPPLPLAQPLKLEAIEAYDLEPLPLPYIAAKPIAVLDSEEDEDDDEDDSDESSEEYVDGTDLVGHGHGYEKEAGNEYGEKHHAAHGEKGSKGYNSQNKHANGESGHYNKEHHEGFSSESEGEKKGHHDESDAHGKHHEAAENKKGGEHGHKKHFSKGEDITGYHKVFNKDEFKKDHHFYDVEDNSGHFKKHGHNHKNHGTKKGDHKEGGHHDSASDKGNFGKGGFLAKGQVASKEVGHSEEKGEDSHYNQQADFGKKGGSAHAKEYAYVDADEEYEDEE